MVVIVAILTTFAANFNIDQAVRAQGQVIAGSRTQVIQAVDGGMLVALHVREGDSVKSGQKLAELEPDRAQAGFLQSSAEVASRTIAITRAHGELIVKDPVFSAYSTKQRGEFVAVQMGIYVQRKRSLEEEVAMMKSALNLAEQELGMNRRLLASGDISQTEVMRAERQVLDIQTRISNVKNKYLQETRTELTRIEEELSVQLQKLNGAENLLYHTDLTAPMDGVVKTLKIHTLGGVLKPGDELMHIAPVGDNLLVEARVLPVDMGQLVVGQAVQISLDAYDYSLYGNLIGELIDISPDTLSDTNAQGSLVNTPNGQPSVYYKVNIRLAKEQTNPKAQLIEIKPGMTASIDIRTGTRNLLNYLMKPVIKTLGNSLNER
jgi:adhesin transport system membrane fusion protein